MTPSTLRRRLERSGLKQARLARLLGLSTASISLCVAKGLAPKSRPDLAQEIAAEIKKHATAGGSKQNAQRSSAGRSTAEGADPKASSSTKTTEKETDMLLQKQTMHPNTRKHFALAANPFSNDIAQPSDVYISADIRYVRETLWQHTKHGSLLALVGESGCGKTTVLADFKDRLVREARDVQVIEPSVLYMEENDIKGKSLKSAAIVTAILSTVGPSVVHKRDSEARARQLKQLLTDGRRAGQRYVLVIEEAHCLPKATLKHLKRFFELTDGLAPLLSIVLVAQPELRLRLSVNDPDIREVAQRCEFIELPPLDNNLADYLKFKLARVGCDLAKVITADGIDALRERLTFAQRRAGSGKAQAQVMSTSVSLVYPLAVANALTAAMNLAASLGAPVVDADIVKEA